MYRFTDPQLEPITQGSCRFAITPHLLRSIGHHTSITNNLLTKYSQQRYSLLCVHTSIKILLLDHIASRVTRRSIGSSS